MPITVVTWGTGNVGRYAVRAVLNHPGLQLVGHIVSGEAKAGKDAIVVEHITRLSDTIAPDWSKGSGYRITIEGEPKMVITMEMEDKHGDHAVGGVIQTATAIVNAIPAVVAHSSGMVAAIDLPKITGKGLYKP